MSASTTKKKTSRKKRAPKIEEIPNILTGNEYLNRELGAIEFNARVLAEACNPQNPLLERVKFLSIFGSNLDELFMKRVGGIKRQILANVTWKTPDGLDPNGQLQLIRKKAAVLVRQASDLLEQELLPALKRENIYLLQHSELNDLEKEWVNGYFKRNVFPVLTPLAVDPGHPFPFLSNLSVSLGVAVKHPDGEDKQFARVKIPKNIPLWIKVDSLENKDQHRFVSMISVLHENLPLLFPQMQILDVMPFKVTRNADIERDEEDAEDLLEMIEEELRLRRFSNIVRLEHGPNPDPWMLKFLGSELEISDEDIYEQSRHLDYTGLNVISELQIPNLKFPVWQPLPPIPLIDEDTNIFNVIKNSDLLVHHPYESFNSSVERFLKTAVDDPKVLAIKMTMYRLGDNSPLVPLLIRAADRGKQVVCLVELKARFDEARNIYWAQELEKAGVHVVYGIVGLKTHTKTLLVVRDEPDGVRSYVHIGTGNYHSQTAKVYTDLGLFTAKEEFTSDVVDLFHFLTGRSLKKSYNKLLVAPVNMREKFLEMIEREGQNALLGKPAHIIAKCNSLEDQQLMKALYMASRRGVKIDLIVRGFCCLRPQVQGLSDNIRVHSIVGRFLEHSRVFYFRNSQNEATKGEMYIGSADWMYRNLNNRVEAIAPIEEPAHKERIFEILQTMLNDEVQSWELTPDGSYKRRLAKTAGALSTFDQLMNLTRIRYKIARDEVSE